MLIAAILNREVVKAELLSQIHEILTGRIADVGPDYILRIKAEFADFSSRAIAEFPGRDIQTFRRNQKGTPSTRCFADLFSKSVSLVGVSEFGENALAKLPVLPHPMVRSIEP